MQKFESNLKHINNGANVSISVLIYFSYIHLVDSVMAKSLSLKSYWTLTNYALAHMTCLIRNPPRGILDIQIRQSLLCHPLVGLIIGIHIFWLQYVLHLFDALLVAAVLLLVWVWLTRLAHISGFVNSVQSWFDLNRPLSFSSKEQEQDTNFSWQPTVAIILLLIIKFTGLVQATATENFGAIFIACVVARTIPVGLLAFTAYDSSSTFAGLAKVEISKRNSLICVSAAVVLTILLAWYWAIVIIGICAAGAFLVYYVFKKRKKKVSGDHCNAMIEISEAVVLWTAVL